MAVEIRRTSPTFGNRDGSVPSAGPHSAVDSPSFAHGFNILSERGYWR
ncbi:hypothetical protein [Pseudomonas capeferrum]|nr:hypothetical protein [Pseudomonas capeferrum]